MKITSNTFSEVYSFLGVLGYDFINKLPDREYCRIMDLRNKKYNPKYVLNDFMEDKKISKEAKCIILIYHLKYWCDSNEERMEIVRKIKGKNK